jgi:predicted solute-binding protein
MTNNKINKLKNIIHLYTNTETMTNETQQTAVEWLEKICNDRGYYLMSEYFQQAKEMDKERMIGFTNKYINEELWVNCNAIESDSTVEQYYEKTYGGNK